MIFKFYLLRWRRKKKYFTIYVQNKIKLKQLRNLCSRRDDFFSYSSLTHSPQNNSYTIRIDLIKYGCGSHYMDPLADTEKMKFQIDRYFLPGLHCSLFLSFSTLHLSRIYMFDPIIDTCPHFFSISKPRPTQTMLHRSEQVANRRRRVQRVR